MMTKIPRKKLKNMRARRIRKKIRGTASAPRLTIFRSNKHLYAQVIDDSKGVTLASASDLKMDKKKSKDDRASAVGEQIAEECRKKKIKQVIFDKGGYKYTGLLQSIAEAARKKSLKF